eukprot:Hpha_TRINITY_DN15338_c2_g1::TRINITY_DN15338_c2_g1_i1::g.89157::m.89157
MLVGIAVWGAAGASNFSSLAGQWRGPMSGECRDSTGRLFPSYAGPNVTDATACRIACDEQDFCGSFTLDPQGDRFCTLHTDVGSVPTPPEGGWGWFNATYGRGVHPTSRNETEVLHEGEGGGPAECYCRACKAGDFADPTGFPTYSPLTPTVSPTASPSNGTIAPALPTVSPSRIPTTSPTHPTSSPTRSPTMSPTMPPPGSYQTYVFWYGRCEASLVRAFYIRRLPCDIYHFGASCIAHLPPADAAYTTFFGSPPCSDAAERGNDDLYAGNASCRVPRDVRWSRLCHYTAAEAWAAVDSMLEPRTGGWFVQQDFSGLDCSESSQLTAASAERVDVCVWYPGMPHARAGAARFRQVPCVSRGTADPGETTVQAHDLTYTTHHGCADPSCAVSCGLGKVPIQSVHAAPSWRIGQCATSGPRTRAFDYFTSDAGQWPVVHPQTAACIDGTEKRPASSAPPLCSAPLALVMVAAAHLIF